MVLLKNRQHEMMVGTILDLKTSSVFQVFLHLGYILENQVDRSQAVDTYLLYQPIRPMKYKYILNNQNCIPIIE